jgi:phosphohistidine swiveling domain-containing protein
MATARQPVVEISGAPSDAIPRRCSLKILELGEVLPEQLDTFGGKAIGLARLIRAGARVPPGFAVEAGRLPPASWDDADRETFERRCTRLLSQGRLAVRSSAIGEDSGSHSFAGLFETVLRLESVDAALGAAAHCIASGESQRVVAYANRTPPVGLVCQLQVESAVAGVCFTRDPLGKDGALLIEAVAGGGDALVSGHAQPEQWRVYRNGFRDWELVGTPALRGCITRRQLRRLATEAHALAQRFGQPLDLEWALDANDKLWWLQCRPITASVPAPVFQVDRSAHGMDEGPVTVWGNWNFRETMPDPLPPFSWSVWRDVMAPLLIEAISGLPHGFPYLQQLNMVDRVQGRIYWNMNAVLSLYGNGRLLSVFVGSVDRGAVEVLRPLIRDGLLQPRTLPISRFAIGWATLPQHLRNFRGLLKMSTPEDVLERMAQKGRQLAHVRDRDLESVTDAALVAQFTALLTDPIFPFEDEFPALAMAMVIQFVARWFFRKDAAAARLLTAGMSRNPTTLMSVSIDDMVGEARGIAHLFQGPPATILCQLDRDPAGRAWLEHLKAFLALNGQRCPGEFDVSVPRWSDDPSMLIELIRAHLAAPPGEPLRQKLERLTEERKAVLAAAVSRAPFYLRPLLRRLGDWVIRFVPLREAPKHQLLIGFQVVRKAALEIGRRLVARGALLGPEDAFFLEWRELVAALETPDQTWQELVVKRREEHARFLALKAPEFVRSDGVPVATLSDARTADGRHWFGTAVSGGHGRGPVKVLRTPDPSLMADGDVLVLEFADPGWTPLFPRASALVMEVGGVMCHAAVVARELGIPAVFGVTKATHLLKDGQSVLVDGDAGSITAL